CNNDWSQRPSHPESRLPCYFHARRRMGRDRRRNAETAGRYGGSGGTMRTARAALAILLASPSSGLCDWPTFGGDSQRTGWAAHETILNRSNVGTLEVKWKLRLDNAPKELTSLTAPIVVDGVKIPQGIKEYVIVGGSSDKIFAIDADTGKLVW